MLRTSKLDLCCTSAQCLMPSASLLTQLTENFNNPEFTEEQLDFLMKKFPACMGHLIILITSNKTGRGYKWQDFYEDDLPYKE